MNNAVFRLERPRNEPVRRYDPGGEEMESLRKEILRQSETEIEIPLIIGGKECTTGDTVDVRMPHDHGRRLAVCHRARREEAELAVRCALEAKEAWLELPWEERVSISLKAAELIAGKYRNTLNAATILGQSKNIQQAEIDAACETVDFLRFNAYFASEIYRDQPLSTQVMLNRIEYRPLEGFVYAVTPFNFTAIASNLNMAPVIMGNVTVWKPAQAAVLSNYYLMQIFREAGVPDGVINFVPCEGRLLSEVVFSHSEFAGLHFTGSNATFNALWRQIAGNLTCFRSYPRVVGETGGKDFIFAHASADPDALSTAIALGAFEYQGQKCSAASRAYIPASLWPRLEDELCARVAEIKMGDAADPANLMGAVIDRDSYNRIMRCLERVKSSPNVKILTGGDGDSSKGYFIEPTVLVCEDPRHETMETELFAPVISIYIYEDEEYDKALALCNDTSPYGLTGSVFSNDRYAAMEAFSALRYAAGNFYFNDKPTGAVVGQQPFGGSRASGTNDKSGGRLNLLRWVSPRTIKETFVPLTDVRYPHMRRRD